MVGKKRPSEDNVIYANFGERRRVSSAEETGEKVLSARAVSTMSAPAQRVINAALRKTDLGRANRGRDYAFKGHVVNLEFNNARINASVVGSQNYPFEVSMMLPFRAPREVRVAVGELARNPGALERAMQGDFPDTVLDVMLFSSPNEVYFSCTCPDSASVCKHAVALAQVAASRVHTTPSLVFTLRDLSMASVEQAVREEATSIARENTEPGSKYFWAGRDLPPLPHPKAAPMIDDSDTGLLHRAMQTVSFTNIDQLRAVSDITELYDDLITD